MVTVIVERNKLRYFPFRCLTPALQQHLNLTIVTNVCEESIGSICTKSRLVTANYINCDKIQKPTKSIFNSVKTSHFRVSSVLHFVSAGYDRSVLSILPPVFYFHLAVHVHPSTRVLIVYAFVCLHRYHVSSICCGFHNYDNFQTINTLSVR
jgi:hypothetical protein